MAGKPDARPERPWFSSGPTAKRPGWTRDAIRTELIGRGIRAPEVVERFAHALRLTRSVLAVPDDFVMLYTPGSDTGSVEAALWSMLGARPCQVIAYENFGLTWAQDVRDHLRIEPEVLEAPWGELPDLSRVDPTADVVFPWNGTTSGVRVPGADWISAEREGLAICDATSAAFAMTLDWPKLDVVTFSFQKALGGEAGIGVMCLSPRAVARLDAYRAPWPIPKVLRLQNAPSTATRSPSPASGGGEAGFDRALATGTMINTFSVATIEDWIDALEWAESVGGVGELIARTERNFAALAAWVERTPWVDFLAANPAIRSTTSVCLKIVDERVTRLDDAGRQAFVKRMKGLLEAEGVAFDVESHRNAPAGLRLWCGPTVETADIEAVGPWLDWAFDAALAS